MWHPCSARKQERWIHRDVSAPREVGIVSACECWKTRVPVWFGMIWSRCRSAARASPFSRVRVKLRDTHETDHCSEAAEASDDQSNSIMSEHMYFCARSEEGSSLAGSSLFLDGPNPNQGTLSSQTENKYWALSSKDVNMGWHSMNICTSEFRGRSTLKQVRNCAGLGLSPMLSGVRCNFDRDTTFEKGSHT